MSNSEFRRRGGRPKVSDGIYYALQHEELAVPSSQPLDQVITMSQDKRRTITKPLGEWRPKTGLKPQELDDPLAEWVPSHELPADIDFSAEMGDADRSSYPSYQPEASSEDPKKRKRSNNASEDPMHTWRAVSPRFLHEMIRTAGLGDYFDSPRCCGCAQELHTGGNEEEWSEAALRCRDCSPGLLWCRRCCLKEHACLPLHCLESWNESFWTRATLFGLGLIYQLGHGGLPCPAPSVESMLMTVLGNGGIQTVRVRYCECSHSERSRQPYVQLLRNQWYPATVLEPHTCATFECLDWFRTLNVVSSVNVRDFVTTLERMTDGMHTGDVADRYKSFGRMTRQYAFLLRMKRAGRGHEEGGIESTPQGGAAVQCWACPHEGINLPVGWGDVADEYKFLYYLFVAMDANFRFRNRLRGNARSDLPLGAGLGYQVDEGPYREHLKGYVNEEDKSTCLAFAALEQKNTRLSIGLRASGVGAVVCSRHELIRPLGMGDLQKGERYANMDYIFFSSIVTASVGIFITYDIICQWRVNLQRRMDSLPTQLQRDKTLPPIQTALPVWHGDVHLCRAENLVQYQRGSGKVDGEAPERVWAQHNEVAYATKEMGIGTRHDAIEDRLDHHNHIKNTKIGDTLYKRHRLALIERERQREEYEELHASVSKELTDEWEKTYEAWYKDRSQPTPFATSINEEITGAQVRLQLRKEEAADAAAGKSVGGTSLSAFLDLGLELEGIQRRIAAQSAAANLTVVELSKLETTKYRFFSKLKRFRTLQEIYMPAAARAVTDEEDLRDADAPPTPAEKVKLWMPSELSEAQRKRGGCKRGLPKVEIKVREGQCGDALRRIRASLHTKRHLILFRNTHVRGQRENTRSRGVIDSVGVEVKVEQAKYNHARACLISLKGEEHVNGGWRFLSDEDLVLDEELPQDADATRRLGLIGSNRTRIHMEQSQKRRSWIWTGLNVDDEQQVNEAMRIDWSKARARKERWAEEVLLLEEEMRRVIRFLNSSEELWWKRADFCGQQDDRASVSGIRGYAHYQAHLMAETRQRFQKLWTGGEKEGAHSD